MPHAVVVKPLTTEEVSAIVKIANKYRVPVTPYGAGTSLEGHYGGVSLSSLLTDQILRNSFSRTLQARYALIWTE